MSKEQDLRKQAGILITKAQQKLKEHPPRDANTVEALKALREAYRLINQMRWTRLNRINNLRKDGRLSRSSKPHIN